ncbi:hypothetical protein L2D14_08305 [Thalassospiraceae bacterium LMO-JJ14]|nr:hypothetical protein L2D14_08305 [Thalassospiraceae bacterium LMO-JJ14]
MATQPTARKAMPEHSWTITGASAETREKVKKAASAEGMTIRAWVDKTLNAAADGKLPARGGRANSAETKALAEMSAKLDELMKRLPDDAKAAEKAMVTRTSAAILKAVAAGFNEMQRVAKDQARIAEGKPAKKKAKKTAAPTSTGTA